MAGELATEQRLEREVTRIIEIAEKQVALRVVEEVKWRRRDAIGKGAMRGLAPGAEHLVEIKGLQGEDFLVGR